MFNLFSQFLSKIFLNFNKSLLFFSSRSFSEFDLKFLTKVIGEFITKGILSRFFLFNKLLTDLGAFFIGLKLLFFIFLFLEFNLMLVLLNEEFDVEVNLSNFSFNSEVR